MPDFIALLNTDDVIILLNPEEIVTMNGARSSLGADSNYKRYETSHRMNALTNSMCFEGVDSK